MNHFTAERNGKRLDDTGCIIFRIVGDNLNRPKAPPAALGKSGRRGLRFKLRDPRPRGERRPRADPRGAGRERMREGPLDSLRRHIRCQPLSAPTF